jgi:hypothetical protein
VSELLKFGNDVKWKSNDVLEVSGIICKTGTFTDMTGKTATFTEDSIKRLYDNIDDNINLYLLHKDSKIPIGFSPKFRVSDDGQELEYQGFVYDTSSYPELMKYGCDCISPELDVEVEDDVIVGGRITALAFVPNPGIEGTQSRIVPMAFSKKEEITMEEETKSEGMETKKDNTFPYIIEKNTVETKDNPEHLKKIQELEEKLKSYQGIDEKYNNVMNERLEKAKKEVIDAGYKDIDTLIEGLPYEKAMELMNKLKETKIMKEDVRKPTYETKVPKPESADSVKNKILEKYRLYNYEYKDGEIINKRTGK